MDTKAFLEDMKQRYRHDTEGAVPGFHVDMASYLDGIRQGVIPGAECLLCNDDFYPEIEAVAQGNGIAIRRDGHKVYLGKSAKPVPPLPMKGTDQFLQSVRERFNAGSRDHTYGTPQVDVELAQALHRIHEGKVRGYKGVISGYGFFVELYTVAEKHGIPVAMYRHYAYLGEEARKLEAAMPGERSASTASSGVRPGV